MLLKQIHLETFFIFWGYTYINMFIKNTFTGEVRFIVTHFQLYTYTYDAYKAVACTMYNTQAVCWHTSHTVLRSIHNYITRCCHKNTMNGVFHSTTQFLTFCLLIKQIVLHFLFVNPYFYFPIDLYFCPCLNNGILLSPQDEAKLLWPSKKTFSYGYFLSYSGNSYSSESILVRNLPNRRHDKNKILQYSYVGIQTETWFWIKIHLK